MRTRNPTTVILTKLAQEVKDDLAPIFGLKNILSAGLVVFGRLTSDEQKQLVTEANKVEPSQNERETAEIVAAAEADAAKQKRKAGRRHSKSAG